MMDPLGGERSGREGETNDLIVRSETVAGSQYLLGFYN